MSLRHPLLSWERSFDFFSAEASSCLIPWARRVYAQLGARPQPRSDSDGDPDGYAGISRRGPFTRTLLSEWALAQALPLEFLRRIVDHELGFMTLDRQTHDDPKATLLLFDTGPEQLGAPRLVHLALAMAFAHRCSRAGAELLVGAVRDPNSLRVGCDEATLRSILDARSLEPYDPSHLEAWRTRLETEDLHITDRWIVGGPSVAAATKSGDFEAAIVGEDPEDPSRLELDLVRRQRSRLGTPLQLDLPEEHLCIYLLRDPFSERKVHTPFRGDKRKFLPRGPLYFSSCGSRLLCRDARGMMLAYHVPHSPAAKPGRVRSYTIRPDEIIVAAGMNKRRVVCLSVADDALWLRRLGRDARDVALRGASEALEVIRREAARGSEPRPIWVSGSGGGTHRLFVLAGSGELLEIRWDRRSRDADGSVAIHAFNVVAARPRSADSHFLCNTNAAGELRLEGSPHGTRVDPTAGALNPAFEAWTRSEVTSPERSAAQRYLGWPWGLLAHRVDGDTIRAWDRRTGYVDFHAPAGGFRAEGIVRYGPNLRLVGIDEEGRTLVLRRENGSMRLRRFTSAIVDVAVSDPPDRVAALTSAGELWVYSLTHRAVLLHVSARESGGAK